MKAIRLFSVGMVAALGAWATDISGKWISETPVRDGNTAAFTMIFKADHHKLTGTSGLNSVVATLVPPGSSKPSAPFDSEAIG